MPTTKTVYVARRHVAHQTPPIPGVHAVMTFLEPGTILPGDFDPDSLSALIETGYVDAYAVPVTTPEEGEHA